MIQLIRDIRADNPAFIDWMVEHDWIYEGKYPSDELTWVVLDMLVGLVIPNV